MSNPMNEPTLDGFFEDKSKFSLLHSWSEFYLNLNVALKQFPKRDRHGIGERMENIAFDILDYLILASKKDSASRLLLLEKMDRELIKEKILVRLSNKIGAMNDVIYIDLEKRILEMGKQVGGWIKYEKEEREKVDAKKERL